MPTDTTSLVVIAVSSCVALLLAVPLWRKPGGAAGKLLWTAVLAFPVAGPVAFAVLHDPPAPKAGCGSCGPVSCRENEEPTRLGRGPATGGEGLPVESSHTGQA